MINKDRYNAIQILNFINMYCNLDSIDNNSREDIIKFIINEFSKARKER